MNKADREILKILRNVFQLKRVRPMESDHNMRLWIIRSAFLVSIIGLASRIFSEFMGREISAEYSAMINTPIAFFFTVLFIHINNEIKDTSIIIFVLTWVALMVSLYV